MSIRSICTPGQEGRRWAVGESPWWEPKPGATIVSIRDTDKSGQMARVPWFEVIYSDGRTVEVNAAHVEWVEREGGGQ